MNAIRLLTPEAAAQIKYFYKRPMWIGFGTIFILAFGAQIVGWASFFLFNHGFWGGVIFAIIVVYIDWHLHNQKIERAKEVYQYGEQITIRLVSIVSNYSAKMNGAPQQIITIDKGTELVKIKTFSARVIRAFSPMTQVAYVYDKYPDALVPVSIFSKDFFDPSVKAKPKIKVRSIDI